MAIRIYKDEKANSVIFEGATFPSYPNGLLTASVNTTDTGSIDVLNIAATSGSTIDFTATGSNSYELFRYPYTSFVDVTGSAFSSSADFVTYFNTVAQQPSINEVITSNVQGYYGLLSGYYFDGSSTFIEIDETLENTWIDVPIEIHPSGTFDYRPDVMVEAQPIGIEDGPDTAITGSDSNVIPARVFKLEGLDISSFCQFRGSIAFDPDEDGGQLEGRLLFNRHSGTTPSSDFNIADTILEMTQGAAASYPAEPFLSFFVGDTIDTNGAGDAGKCRFQVKSTVQGTLEIKALTWYINR